MRLYHEVRRYVALPFKLNSYARFIELLLMKKRYQCASPQLFIMGLPRSGTTLIYQYIVHRLQVSYFTNGVGQLPNASCITTFLQHKIYRQYIFDFKSNYGKVIGPVSPREAGAFWCRFFDINNYTLIDDLSDNDIYILKNTIACVQKIFFGAPFVNKNVKHLLRIGALNKIFPNSQFLIVERDIEDTAISVLRGRYKNLSDPQQWWSVKPPNYETLKNLSVVEQVYYQCRDLKQKMEQDLLTITKNRIIRVNYKDFCNNPEELIQNLAITLNTIETRNPPRSHFKISHDKGQTEEEKKLVQLIRGHANE